MLFPISSAITNAATSLTLTSGQGARFPTITGGNSFYATLANSSNVLEIVQVTATVGDTFTIVRAQDGTTASAYSIGDRCELRPTAALFNSKADGAATTAALALLAPIASPAFTGAPTVNGAAIVIPGEIKQVAFATPPTGWLACNGGAVSRTTYATLFAAIATTWGAGDGSTTFNVPDLRGRALIGAGTGTGLTARTLGTQNIGEETHVLVTAELASHNHVINISDPTHVHTLNNPAHGHTTNESPHSHPLINGVIGTAGTASIAVPGGATQLYSPASTGTASTGITINNATTAVSANAVATGITATSNANGSGTAHNNMQPSAVVTFIIKT